ncbi:hypothetical protein FRB98_001002 [Tulasnella sp. 332]|nr:hypothetical protein FRB98_001002 [Tulasnella sp. 332]
MNLKNAHDEVEKAPHKAKLSHQLIAGAAAFEECPRGTLNVVELELGYFAPAYEHHEASNGTKVRFALIKSVVAAAIGAYIDRIVESKGLDWLDKEKAKKEAMARVEEQVESET